MVSEVKRINLASRLVGLGQPCFIIAEAGVNHNGDIEQALALIDAAVAAGADAVKFQTFKAESLVTGDAPKALYQKERTPENESQFRMLKRLELSYDDHRRLKAYCEDKEVLFLSTPFDEKSADLLERMEVFAFKVSSGDATNLPLLKHMARKGRPMILSTGMCSLAEVEAAVDVIRKLNDRLVLLHCVSSYPAEVADVNLRAMHTMENAFGLPVGFSDHTLGVEVAMAAVALGACVIEKHLTLDRNLLGPDHAASLVPEEFSVLVKGIRRVEVALGHGRKEPAACEMNMAAAARKSLVAAKFIAAGSVLTKGDLTIKRPGTGLAPAMFERIIGRQAVRDIPADAPIMQEMIQ